MVETYLAENTRDGLPRTTIERRRAELAEFIEIVGDRPATAYTTRDGTAFNTVQDTLPSMRNVPPFRGLSLIGAGKKATQMIADGKAITLLNPVTIKTRLARSSASSNGRESKVLNSAERRCITPIRHDDAAWASSDRLQLYR